MSVLVSASESLILKALNVSGLNLEARGGIEPPIELLQSSALPLGDRAVILGRRTLQRFPQARKSRK